MRRFAASVTLLVWLASIAPAARAGEPESPPSISLPAELARVLTDYEDAWSRKDASALAQLFTEDGWVLQNGAPPARGRAAIEKAYAGSGGPLALRAFAFRTEGDTGYILGGFARRRGDPDVGKFTLALSRTGGRWLIVSDMDNGNRPRGAD
jgi:ketosteroid isomerase-like protein